MNPFIDKFKMAGKVMDVCDSTARGLIATLQSAFNSLSRVAHTGSYNDLIDQPSIPPEQVNSDWNATSGVAEILNKPTIPEEQVNSDWDATSGKAEILNKPKLLSSANVNYSLFTWDDTNKRYICTYNVPSGKELIGVLVTSKNAPQGIAIMNGYYNAGINTIMVTGWNVPLATPITSSYEFICNVILRDL